MIIDKSEPEIRVVVQFEAQAKDRSCSLLRCWMLL